MGGGGKVEVISSKGCSRLLAEISPSIPSFRGRGFQSDELEPTSPASTASAPSESAVRGRPRGPFSGLVICVTGLSKVFTLNLLNTKITFFIGPEVSAHLFKASKSDLSQQEVYQFNVPTFGPGVIFNVDNVDYSIRQEQFRFFTEALRVTKLKAYVEQMVSEASVFYFFIFIISNLYSLRLNY